MVVERAQAIPELKRLISSFPRRREVTAWRGIQQASAGTPPTIIDKLHRETVHVLALPELRKRLEEPGLDVIGSSPAEFAALIKAEIPQWAKVIKDAGIKATE